MKRRSKRWLAAVTAVCTMGAVLPLSGLLAEAAYTEENASFLNFTEEEAVLEKGLSEGISISETVVMIDQAGIYVFSGTCSDGSIQVKKGTTGVTIVLDGLDLTAQTTAPILCEKSTSTEILAMERTVNTLSDTDANADEGAAIKVKSGSELILDGSGSLNVSGNYKNGIKGAAETDITVREQKLTVTAVDNGIASDNSVTMESGIITIEAGGDGIKSSPDEDDTLSVGDLTFVAGEYHITAAADGIQGDHSVVIQNGSFDITTNDGYTTVLAEDADSCKGIKSDSLITIYDGDFQINSADDAVHCNDTITILGGRYEISTGDDGMHAETLLEVGTENGAENPDIKVTESYEGLEAGTINIYGGDIYVQSQDDGMNVTGDEDNTSENPGGGDSFNPIQPGDGQRPRASVSEYTMNIYGGNIFVMAGGDGLDANGDINISGGTVLVYGAASDSSERDNSPFDFDGTFLITGGTVFGAGSSAMIESPASSSSQKFVEFRSNYSKGTTINVMSTTLKTPLFSTILEENVNYIIYSSDEIKQGSSYQIQTGVIETETETEKKTETETEKKTETETETEKKTETETEQTQNQQTEMPSESESAAVKPGKVSSIKAAAVSTKRIRLTWSRVTGAAGYQIYRYNSSSKTYEPVKTITGAETTSTVLTGLKAGYAYQYRVAAYVTKAGQTLTGDSSNSVKVCTKPSKASIKKVTAKKNTVTVKWKKQTGTGYQIQYTTRKNFAGSKKTVTAANSKKTSVILKKLKTGTTYSIRVRAIAKSESGVSYGAWSKIKKITL